MRILGVIVTLAVLAVAHAAFAIEQSSAGTSSTSNRDPLGEVTITGHAELARGVSKFVDQIAARENAEGLPRWNEQVCPLVTGLPREEGELILGRISEVARAAEVPLAGEDCHPNLYVIVISDPRKALAGLDVHRRMVMFGDTSDSVIRAFIDTPRAVRVWYDSRMTDPFGMPGLLPSCLFGPFCHPIFEHTIPTRLSFNRIWNFSRVVLVVDKDRLNAVSPAQLADYAAMVGLAEIRPQARLDEAQTILKLFDSTPGAAPARMTGWDQSFLKSLYATEQKSVSQRGEIALTMVRDMAR